MTEPQWLSRDEQLAWRSFLTGSELLSIALDRELREQHGIGMPEYEILVRLSEHEDHTMRMALLATDTTMSRSRLTHCVARMEKRGLLRRVPIAEDGRGVNCVMTEAGWDLLRSCAPDHVESVRHHLVDLLDADEMATLGRIFDKVTTHLRNQGMTQMHDKVTTHLRTEETP
ncbi:MarR family winged helix-turn-helix transcriptional regulator [Brevibacterium sp.]|uniref:MarR family winged helix-turn-helix transcriptional regulator n=1 Tax=Brevibacterium sp. TaxID=1701 RepID=UPI002811B5BD|nr:MarR family winged helix-turn-helix transcriptional regulator [Brevibacterium sp.]